MSMEQLVTYEDYSRDNLIFEDVKEIKVKGSSVTYTACNIFYQHPDGTKGYFLYEGLRGFCVKGVRPMWSPNLPEESRNETNIDGYNICRNLVPNKELGDSPDDYPEECKAYMAVLDDVRKAASEHLRTPKQMALIEKYAGGVAGNVARGLKGFKPAYSPEGTYIDKKDNQQKRSAPSLWNKLRFLKEKKEFLTQVWDADDEQKSPIDFVDVNGYSEPVDWIKGIYVGTHGNKNPYGASLQIQVWQMNYYPVEMTGMAPPQKRLTGKSKKFVPQDVEEDDSDKDDEVVPEDTPDKYDPEEESEEEDAEEEEEDDDESEEEEVPPPRKIVKKPASKPKSKPKRVVKKVVKPSTATPKSKPKEKATVVRRKKVVRRVKE